MTTILKTSLLLLVSVAQGSGNPEDGATSLCRVWLDEEFARCGANDRGELVCIDPGKAVFKPGGRVSPALPVYTDHLCGQEVVAKMESIYDAAAREVLKGLSPAPETPETRGCKNALEDLPETFQIYLIRNQPGKEAAAKLPPVRTTGPNGNQPGAGMMTPIVVDKLDLSTTRGCTPKQLQVVLPHATAQRAVIVLMMAIPGFAASGALLAVTEMPELVAKYTAAKGVINGPTVESVTAAFPAGGGRGWTALRTLTPGRPLYPVLNGMRAHVPEWIGKLEDALMRGDSSITAELLVCLFAALEDPAPEVAATWAERAAVHFWPLLAGKIASHLGAFTRLPDVSNSVFSRPDDEGLRQLAFAISLYTASGIVLPLSNEPWICRMSDSGDRLTVNSGQHHLDITGTVTAKLPGAPLSCGGGAAWFATVRARFGLETVQKSGMKGKPCEALFLRVAKWDGDGEPAVGVPCSSEALVGLYEHHIVTAGMLEGLLRLMVEIPGALNLIFIPPPPVMMMTMTADPDAPPPPSAYTKALTELAFRGDDTVLRGITRCEQERYLPEGTVLSIDHPAMSAARRAMTLADHDKAYVNSHPSTFAYLITHLAHYEY